MKILWFTWKDLTHPQAGGAERINEEITRRLVQEGYEVILVVGGYEGGEPESSQDGYRIIRLGNRYTVYYQAFRYYQRHLKGWADLVIDEMNTIPFFCKFYVQEPNVLLAYQLCREVWFFQMPLPFSVIGYAIEPLYLFLLRDRKVITESESTQKDLIRYGFKRDNIHIIPIGVKGKPLNSLANATKFEQPTLLSLGMLRAMKRTIDQIEAFELAKKEIKDLQLIIAGAKNDRYGDRVLKRINQSSFASDIHYQGCVNEATKIELLRRSHIILVTSIKEGWGLIVTEANQQGTPAVVYNVDGLRDSVIEGRTGWVTKENTPKDLAKLIEKALTTSQGYKETQKNAWDWGRAFNYDACYKAFIEAIKIA